MMLPEWFWAVVTISVLIMLIVNLNATQKAARTQRRIERLLGAPALAEQDRPRPVEVAA